MSVSRSLGRRGEELANYAVCNDLIAEAALLPPVLLKVRGEMPVTRLNALLKLLSGA